MAERLTDRSELVAPPDGNDVVMIVDVDDTTDSPEGTSKFQKVQHFLRGRTFGKNTNVSGTAANTLIFNMSNTVQHPTNQGLAGDFIFFMDEIDTRIIIGVAIATCATFPVDLDNTAKFIKFYEGTKLLP